MQDIPLSVARILEYGRTIHANTQVTSWHADGPETTTFAAVASRASALANALRDELGIDGDQRIGTLMYNCAEHLEVFLGVASMGAVFQPLNQQLMHDQIVHIINHAHDEIIICDPALAEGLGRMLPECPGVRAVIIIGTSGVEEAAAHLPDGVPWYSYEALLDGRPSTYDWPELDETLGAAMCYSTGTEGAPKGVIYSHRSLYLHSLNLRTTDSFAISHGTPWLCCVPIYHVLSWGVPLANFMCGAPMVFPGADLSAARLAEIIATSLPRVAQGVPTLWISLMVHYLNNPPERMSLQDIFVGGSPAPPALIRMWEERYGVDVIHLWGMTETSPVGTVARPPSGASGEARQRYRVSQGRFPGGRAWGRPCRPRAERARRRAAGIHRVLPESRARLPPPVQPTARSLWRGREKAGGGGKAGPWRSTLQKRGSLSTTKYFQSFLDSSFALLSSMTFY